MSLDNQPLVSVTIPVYNAEKYLKETIESILNQTYKYFELIIVNDASTDGSKELILSFKDPRILYLENSENSGIVYTRNHCLRYATGKYIAILDADDIALPTRLEKQVEFLESHSDYGYCGSYYEVVDSNGNFTVRIKVPSNSSEIKSFLLFNNCFCHSSVMIRRELIADSMFTHGYDIIEDYEMAYRLSRTTKLANLPEFIVKYRVHGKNQTVKNAEKMLSLRKKMDARILKDLNIQFTDFELALHSNFVNSNFLAFKTHADLQNLEAWLLKLYAITENKKEFNSETIARIIIKRWILLFYLTKRVSYKIFYTRVFWNFRTRFMKYMLEFLSDRFRKQFRVA
jgi:glycosyltransferase involved in cell wall biosynthesis